MFHIFSILEQIETIPNKKQDQHGIHMKLPSNKGGPQSPGNSTDPWSI